MPAFTCGSENLLKTLLLSILKKLLKNQHVFAFRPRPLRPQAAAMQAAAVTRRNGGGAMREGGEPEGLALELERERGKQ